MSISAKISRCLLYLWDTSNTISNQFNDNEHNGLSDRYWKHTFVSIVGIGILFRGKKERLERKLIVYMKSF